MGLRQTKIQEEVPHTVKIGTRRTLDARVGGKHKRISEEAIVDNYERAVMITSLKKMRKNEGGLNPRKPLR